MLIMLKRFITRKELADKLQIHPNTLANKMKEVPELKESAQSCSKQMLDSNQVTYFFRYFRLYPYIICDLAEIVDWPGMPANGRQAIMENSAMHSGGYNVNHSNHTGTASADRQKHLIQRI